MSALERRRRAGTRTRARVTCTCTILFAALAPIAASIATSPAHAQTAAAIGRPLPSPDMPAGSVSVRVVAGSPSKPVVGTEVTLVVNGTPRVARTDAAGRAHFKDLPAAAKVQAKVLDDEKKEIASDEFPLPGDTGVRLMLTTLPWNPAGGGGAAMADGAGAAQQPNPRAMSGEPRPEPADAPGTYTVRLSYDDFKGTPPIGVPVTLIGYAADNKVTVHVQKTDDQGRARFQNLDRKGATAYFAMTMLPRGSGLDRLTAKPVVLDPRGGARLILSSEKIDSTAAPLDDLEKMEKQESGTPAGKVRITLEGGVDPNQFVTLIDAATNAPLGRAKPTSSAAADTSQIQIADRFSPRPDAAPGALEIKAHGGAGGDDAPLGAVQVRLLPVIGFSAVGATKGDPMIEEQSIVTAVTAADGVAKVALPTQVKVMSVDAPTGATGTAGVPVLQWIAEVTIHGKVHKTQPFDASKMGGLLDVIAEWAPGKPEVVFEHAATPGQVVYAETTMHGNLYRTLPFQPVGTRGTRATLFIFPRILFSFSLTSRIDDEYLAVNGRFEVSNNSWIPYVGGPDGLIVPLPRGFTGGLVAEKDQGDVALEPKQGFRLIRPIPPGARRFHGAFSLPVDDGKVTWALDLPLGAFNSGMEILEVKGMRVTTPPGVKGERVEVPQGAFFVLPQISILPKQSMVLTIEGLPAEPAWRVWTPRIVGILVALVMLGGIAFALVRKRPDQATAAAREARRQQLLDELVTLEHDKTGPANAKRREQLVAELEQLWDTGSPS